MEDSSKAIPIHTVNRTNNRGLANSETCDESPGVNSSKTATIAHKDCNTQNPQDAELARSPYSTDAIADDEGEQSTANRTNLDHGGYVGLDISLLDIAI